MTLTLFHAPHTRSTGVLCLLEELEIQYQLRVLKLATGEHRQPAYLSVNPMGKVPALKHHDAVVTEQAAIFMYLADLYPEKNLAPALNSALRGPYLRWMVFYGSSFEPALIDRFAQRDPGNPGMSPYGDFDILLNTITAQLEKGPYFLGQTFSALDILWGKALHWALTVKLLPELPVLRRYVDHISARPAIHRARAQDADLAAAQASQ